MKIRQIFSKFKPYVWEMSSREIAAEARLPESRIIRMDTNTSPYVPESAMDELSRGARALPINEYPDTSYKDLRNSLSTYCDTKPNNLVVTNGADEALDIIVKTFLTQGDQVVIPIPTYSMFRVCSELMGARVRYVRRTSEFEISANSIKKHLTERTRMIFLCSPNNPTGNTTPSEEVRSILELNPDCGVALDEAYFEYSRKSSAHLTKKYDNLFIIRTFSKAFSMAGVRVGYVISSHSSAKNLNLVRPPNSVGIISLLLAQRALKDKKEMERNAARVTIERERIIGCLKELPGCEVFPSEANFILFRSNRVPSSKVHKQLLKSGFVLRDFSETPGIEGCLRVTVNKEKVNDLFLAALRQALHDA